MILQSFVRDILLVDDDSDDCFIFSKALKEISPEINCTCVHSYDDMKVQLLTSTPDLLFMDLNMPQISGLECLKELKESPQLKRIPVIIYSSSESSKDVVAGYGYGANLYFTKPRDYKSLIKGLIKIFQLNWLAPEEITASYFVEGKYFPFMCE